MFFRILLFLLFLTNCNSSKSDISDSDLTKVVDRMSILRFTSRLQAEDLTAIKKDEQVFQETCKLYRLNPSSVLEKMKKKHPSKLRKDFFGSVYVQVWLHF
jgi:acetyl-CoA carboxylase beta subunit